MNILLTVILSLVTCSALTWCVRHYALRKNVIDIPNARSSHLVPTARGGGVAIFVTFFLGFIVLACNGVLPKEFLLTLMPSSALVAGVGVLDDYRGVLPSARIIAHIVAVVYVLVLLGGGVSIGLPLVDNSPWLSFGLSAIALVWLVNAMNFMDGIDGLAAMETCVVLLSLVVMSRQWSPWHPVSACALILAGATAGFLIWNRAPAKIFMGDVGSGLLGFLVGALSLMMVKEHAVTIWVPVILLAAFLADATVTLLRRMLRGERWYAAHRSHAYQRLSRRWKSHGKVTATVFLVNVLWLCPLAWWAQIRPPMGPWLALTALTPVIVAVMVCGAGGQE